MEDTDDKYNNFFHGIDTQLDVLNNNIKSYNDSISKLDLLYIELEGMLANIQDKDTFLMELLEKLNNEYSSLENEYNSSIKNQESLTTTNKSLQDEIRNLQGVIDNNYSQVNDIDVRNRTLQKQYDDLSSKYNLNQSIIDSYERQQKQVDQVLQQKVANVESRLNDINREYTQNIKNKQDKINNLQENLNSLKRKKSDLDSTNLLTQEIRKKLSNLQEKKQDTRTLMNVIDNTKNKKKRLV